MLDARSDSADGATGGATAPRGAGSRARADVDGGLLVAARGGDEGAFAAIVDLYQRRVWGMCWRYLHDAATADDLVQETFCRLVLTLHRVEGGTHLSPWIHRIATNLCLDELRRQARRPRHDPAADEDAAGEPELYDEDRARQPERFSEASITADLVWSAMRRVPMRQREVLVLCEIYGMTYEEISRRLELRVGAVQGLLHRARERFKVEYVRLLGDSSGDEECVKVAYVVDNMTRSSMRLDRLHAVDRHIRSCGRCHELFAATWLQEDAAAIPPPAVRIDPAAAGDSPDLQAASA
jgi:RNA polymerase sigma-70 factor (ECF subfamily)